MNKERCDPVATQVPPNSLRGFFKDNRKSRRVEAAGGLKTVGTVFLATLAFGNLFAVDIDVARRLDAYAHLRAVHGHDGHFDIAADAERFAGAAGKYQHEFRALANCVPHLGMRRIFFLWAIHSQSL
jgi:hypothetical protein